MPQLLLLRSRVPELLLRLLRVEGREVGKHPGSTPLFYLHKFSCAAREDFMAPRHAGIGHIRLSRPYLPQETVFVWPKIERPENIFFTWRNTTAGVSNGRAGG